MKILINALGVKDSGGITVLKKVLHEIANAKNYKFYIFLFENTNTIKLFNEFKYLNLKFKYKKNKGLIFRILFENLYYCYFAKKNNIDLIYNFSGSAQFITGTKQLVKIHNLLFYSKRLDREYFKNKKYKNWIRHIFIKRLFFKLMLRVSQNIEIQSNHVKDNLQEYLDVSKKTFFLKNDFEVNSNSFKYIKKFDFRKKITFVYIVGPHFHMPHKNIKDFVDIVRELDKNDFNFDIKITLTQKELENSGLWDTKLNSKTKFLNYISKDKINKLFRDNTILISTSIIETLGLHVIEATMNGVLAIVPDESYSKSVYGESICTYRLFDINSFVETIKMIISSNKAKNIIIRNQEYLVKNESIKHKSVIEIFDKILKV